MQHSRLAVALAVLAAGCATPANLDAGTTTVPTAPVGPDPPKVDLAACRESHTFFDTPQQGLASRIPDGFAMADGSVPGVTTTVAVLGWTCGAQHEEIWAGVEVVPPTAFRNSSFDLDILLLQGFALNVTEARVYQDWNITPFVRSEVSVQDYANAGAAARDTLTLGTTALKYTITTNVGSQPGPFAPANYRVWVANGTKATGYLLMVHAGGLSVGAGSAEFSQEGDPAAPPTTYGIGHRADTTTARHIFVPVTPAA